MEIDVNCSGGSWFVYYLCNSKHMLQIKTTDEANNKAIRSHDFSVNFLVNQFKIVEKLVKYAFDLLYNYEE